MSHPITRYLKKKKQQQKPNAISSMTFSNHECISTPIFPVGTAVNKHGKQTDICRAPQASLPSQYGHNCQVQSTESGIPLNPYGFPGDGPNSRYNFPNRTSSGAFLELHYHIQGWRHEALSVSLQERKR